MNAQAESLDRNSSYRLDPMATIVAGLMSGTSGDGVDVAALSTDGHNQIELLGGLTHPYPEELRLRVLEASQHDVPILEMLRLEKEVTQHHVEAVERLFGQLGKKARQVELIGFHGHTVRHVPSEGLTMQIGNPWLLAHALDLPVVSDFRRSDMADHGQGAPLVSLFHQALFAKERRPTLVLNLGGVANVTWLGSQNEIIGGDTGPGCGLIDEWAQTMADLPHDRDGQLASTGTVDEKTVTAVLEAPFFSLPLPKSADRYDFDHVDVSGLSVEDGAATLCAVTAEAIYQAVRRLPEMPGHLWVTGGGVHHPVLMKMLGDRFGEIKDVCELGLNPDTLEAECFAWLAVRHKMMLPLTIPETTGCQRPLSGGVLVQERSGES